MERFNPHVYASRLSSKIMQLLEFWGNFINFQQTLTHTGSITRKNEKIRVSESEWVGVSIIVKHNLKNHEKMVEKTADYEYQLERNLIKQFIIYMWLKGAKISQLFLIGSRENVLYLIGSCFLVWFFRTHSHSYNKNVLLKSECSFISSRFSFTSIS